MRFHIFHKWSEWYQVYSGKLVLPFEYRECHKCCKRQYRDAPL